MTTANHRKHPRIDSLNLLHYTCIDQHQQEVGQGMGRTLNVSVSGIRLETHAPLDTDSVVALTIGLEDDTIQIKGQVVHLEPNSEGRFEAGIEFFDVGQAEQAMLQKYIALFESQR
jgi:hypothetical protein